VAFKEIYTSERKKLFEGPTYDLDRSPCWMTTLGSTGGTRTVCKEANDEVSKFRFPSYIDVERGASGKRGLELRKRGFEVIVNFCSFHPSSPKVSGHRHISLLSTPGTYSSR
jgi:hypothetical protein